MFSLPQRVCFDKMWTDYENMLPFTFVHNFLSLKDLDKFAFWYPREPYNM